MFVDEAKILVAGGNGGNGCCSFRREKFVAKGGPNGGDGGPGGSVIFEADEGESTLLRFRFHQKFSADRGRHGEGSNKTGRGGEDFVVPVPLGTMVYDEDRVRVLADMNVHGQRFVAANGGRGGRGNARFKSSIQQAPTRADPGEEGQTRELRLELKLLADVGLLGFPNAGKSTLIRRISAARPKVADYPFTTLVPNLGVVNRGDYRSFVVADIPGLIDGAHEGAGLGLRFLRHVERCRLLLHLVDMSDPTRDPVERLQALDRELGSHSQTLASKPQVIVASKMDAVCDPSWIEKVRQHAQERGAPMLEVSSATGQGIDELIAFTGRTLDEIPQAEPISVPREQDTP